jgi:hypothetical protein
MWSRPSTLRSTTLPARRSTTKSARRSSLAEPTGQAPSSTAPLSDVVKLEWRSFATAVLMTMGLPEGVLDPEPGYPAAALQVALVAGAGLDQARAPQATPPAVRCSDPGPTASRVLRRSPAADHRLDGADLRGSAHRRFGRRRRLGRLPHRMRYILTLFRSRQQDPRCSTSRSRLLSGPCWPRARFPRESCEAGRRRAVERHALLVLAALRARRGPSSAWSAGRLFSSAARRAKPLFPQGRQILYRMRKSAVPAGESHQWSQRGHDGGGRRGRSQQRRSPERQHRVPKMDRSRRRNARRP